MEELLNELLEWQSELKYTADPYTRETQENMLATFIDMVNERIND